MGKKREFGQGFLRGALVLLLAVGIVLCLVRAVRGPRYTDRLVAMNLICTLVILIVCILSYLLEEPYLVDVAILYGLLNLLAVAVLSRVAVEYRESAALQHTAVSVTAIP